MPSANGPGTENNILLYQRFVLTLVLNSKSVAIMKKKRFKLEVASSNKDNIQPRKARKFATNSLRLILTFMLSKWPPVAL